jgi:hypothetical protein
MRSRLRIPLQNQSGLSSTVGSAGKALRYLMAKLERSWPVSAVLMLLAIVALSQA